MEDKFKKAAKFIEKIQKENKKIKKLNENLKKKVEGNQKGVSFLMLFFIAILSLAIGIAI